jgi:hypothetical protein
MAQDCAQWRYPGEVEFVDFSRVLKIGANERTAI